MLDEYRRRASILVSELRMARYKFLCGTSSAYERDSILREQSDLFIPESINSLQQESEGLTIDGTPFRVVSHLIEFAKCGYLSLAASAISRDIRRLTNSEGSDERQALVIERESILDSAARKLGAKSLLDLKEEALHVDLAASAKQCEALIENAESSGRQLIEQDSVQPASPAAADLAGLYHHLFSGLGFDSTKQKNVALDLTVSAAKRKAAFCALLDVPDDIRIVINPTGASHVDIRNLLHQSGRAQHGAWTSQSLQPELRQYGDSSVGNAWSYLVASIQSEPMWLEGTLGPSAASDACRLAQDIDSSEWLRDAQAVAATSNLSDDGKRVELDEVFRAISRLRGRAFANQLKEHLRLRFGTRWWASRKTGEMLIDLWNTGYTYTLDELASMIGIGTVSLI